MQAKLSQLESTFQPLAEDFEKARLRQEEIDQILQRESLRMFYLALQSKVCVFMFSFTICGDPLDLRLN